LSVGIVPSPIQIETAEEVIQLVQELEYIMVDIDVTGVTQEDIDKTDLAIKQLKVQLNSFHNYHFSCSLNQCKQKKAFVSTQVAH
jgi:hypothetical protein